MKKEMQEQLNKELKAESDAYNELEESCLYEFVEKVMERVEQRRKKLYQKSKIYTQTYLSKKSGLSRSAYDNYRSGYRNSIKLFTLKRLADVLNCDITDFLD